MFEALQRASAVEVVYKNGERTLCFIDNAIGALTENYVLLEEPNTNRCISVNYKKEDMGNNIKKIIPLHKDFI
jgi:hypothetical protein